MPQGLELLQTPRVTAILQELESQIDIPQDLIFLNRAAVRDATDGDILGRFRGDVFISDIIAEDSVALIKGGETYSTQTYSVPKIKHGARINEEMVNLLLRLERGAALDFERLTLRGRITDNLERILLGIRQRLNQILAAMHVGEFNYSQGGVIMTGVTWGQLSDLQFDPAVDWTTANAATMTPILDISTALRYALEEYGVTFNRITLSMTVLNAILGSDEFVEKAQLYALTTFPAGTFPLLNELGPQISLLTTILNSGGQNLQIVVEDSRYKDQRPDGSTQRARFWPENKVLIDNTSNDNNPAVYYLGRAIVPETVVSSVAEVGGMQGRFAGPQRGPVAWVEAPSLNPPNILMWGVDKAWPVLVEPEREIVITAY